MYSYSLVLKALSVTILLVLTGAMLARVKPEDFGLQEKTEESVAQPKN
jgi:hypothetical protein